MTDDHTHRGDDVHSVEAADREANAPDWEGFGRLIVDEWPVGDIEGSYLFDMAVKHGLIREISGGYNPDEHIDAEGICPETGDPWYEYNFGPAAPKEPNP